MNAEDQSLSGVRKSGHKLPGVEALKPENRKCDVCGSMEGVRFWGATSVLVCRKSECNDQVADGWSRCLADIQKESEEW